MNKLDYLLQINPHFRKFKTQEICDHQDIIGYHCFGIDDSNFTFSGGTSSDHETSKRIAIAEAFERSFLTCIARDPLQRKQFLIDKHPSSSGFAAGFSKDSTSFRALCEGLECWAWSKWIDENYVLPRISQPHHLTRLTHHLLKFFNDTQWYSKSFNVIANDRYFNLHFVVFLGFTDDGIFSGSRVSTINDEIWEHPVIEAYRNLKNFLLYQKSNFELKDIIQQRSIFFAQNKDLALDQINKTHLIQWPQPEICLLRNYQTELPEIFLTRCLMKDFTSWHLGDVTRFVY